MSESAESKYRRYIEQRQEYARVASEHLTRFERSVLVASGAGLAAIFSLISGGTAAKSWQIITAVVLFAISFCSMLLSHYFSYHDNENAIVKLDEIFDTDIEYGKGRKWFSYFIEPLNVISLCVMVIGYIFSDSL